jgi:hypothetical protein
MTDRIHGRSSSMLAYRPVGPETVRAAGPVSGIMAQQVNFTSQDQTSEQNLVRYLADANQGVQRYQASVNGTGSAYADTEEANARGINSIAETEA